MAHRVLEVQELLDLILSFVNEDYRGERKATLYAAAQVNSRWLPLSLDYLWSELTIKDFYRFLRFYNQYVSRIAS